MLAAGFLSCDSTPYGPGTPEAGVLPQSQVISRSSPPLLLASRLYSHSLFCLQALEIVSIPSWILKFTPRQPVALATELCSTFPGALLGRRFVRVALGQNETTAGVCLSKQLD